MPESKTEIILKVGLTKLQNDPQKNDANGTSLFLTLVTCKRPEDGTVKYWETSLVRFYMSNRTFFFFFLSWSCLTLDGKFSPMEKILKE